jgi:hypothetical protein
MTECRALISSEFLYLFICFQAHGGDTKDQLTLIVHEKERLRTELSNVQMELASSNDKVRKKLLKTI